MGPLTTRGITSSAPFETVVIVPALRYKGRCRDEPKLRFVAYEQRGAPLSLVLEGDDDCPVCGLGNAFAIARNYDVCARCGWVDDPAAAEHPDVKSETNES